MKVNALKSKIHRATVTDADINYIGSITIDKNLRMILILTSTYKIIPTKLKSLTCPIKLDQCLS